MTTPSEKPLRLRQKAFTFNVFRESLESAAAAEVERTLPAPVPGGGKKRLLRSSRPRVLLLSYGGANGAYGAGFLKGMADASGRDPVEFARRNLIVTGISAGALLATDAFLGRFDEILNLWTNINDDRVMRRRTVLEYLLSNSMADQQPLRELMMSHLTDDVIDHVAAEHRAGRRLFVGAVNLDTGRIVPFDLGGIATRDAPMDTRRADYVDALMASSAIPLQFSPVFIGGDMYVDGGARQLVLFLDEFFDAGEAVRKRTAIETDLRWSVRIILNGDFKIGRQCTANHLIGVAARSFSVAWNQTQVDSLYRVISESRVRGWDVAYTSAEGANCSQSGNGAGDRFDMAYMRCMARFGYTLGSRQDSWRTDLQLLSDESAFSQENPVCP